MYYDPVTREYYDDPSDEEDIRGDYAPNDEHARSAHRALYTYARPLGGAPFSPPTVCHSGCRTLNHRIPSGGLPTGILPTGVSLGASHQIAIEERICLTHVPGGCFDGGICERLNTVGSVDTCIDLGYHGRQFQCQRQVLRVAAGLPPGPPDVDVATANVPGGNREQRGHGQRQQSRHSAGAPGREHHRQHEAQRRRPREPQGYTEEITEPGPSMGRRRGLGLREPPQGFVLPDEVQDSDDNFEGNNPVGGRERRPYENQATDRAGLPQGDHRHHAVPPSAGPSGRHRRMEGGFGGGRWGASSGGYGQGSSGRDVVPRGV